MFTRDDVGPRMVNGMMVELTDQQKDRIVQEWNNRAAEEPPDPTLSHETKALADELGVDQANIIARLKQLRAAQ